MPTSLSRSGSTSPLGKLSYEKTVRLAEPVGEELERQAKDLGLGVGEYIREVLTVKALGYDHVRKLYEARRKRFGKGSVMPTGQSQSDASTGSRPSNERCSNCRHAIPSILGARMWCYVTSDNKPLADSCCRWQRRE